VDHLRTAKHSAVAATILVLAGAGTLLSAAVAAAAPAPAWSSAQVNYRCSLSAFGQGIAPLEISTTVSAPGYVATGTPQTVKFMTAAVPVPAAVASQLGQVSSIGVSGDFQVTWASGAGTGWTGQAALAGKVSIVTGPGGRTEIPSVTATGAVTAKAAGSWYVAAPEFFKVQITRGATQLASLTCHLVKPGKIKVVATGGGGATASPSASASPTASGGAGVTPSPSASVQGTGMAAATPTATTAVGAPNTGAGGSLHSSVDVGLAAGGAALVLGGSGFGLLTLRRRGRSAL